MFPAVKLRIWNVVYKRNVNVIYSQNITSKSVICHLGFFLTSLIMYFRMKIRHDFGLFFKKNNLTLTCDEYWLLIISLPSGVGGHWVLIHVILFGRFIMCIYHTYTITTFHFIRMYFATAYLQITETTPASTSWIVGFSVSLSVNVILLSAILILLW